MQKIFAFLRDIAANNTREWFNAHREEYNAVRGEFECIVGEMITKLSAMDPTIAHNDVRSATYRFNRDTRFSPDKSPYKRHMGAYVAPCGKKGLQGGYYLHLQPGSCFVACGNYEYPTAILNACRREIIDCEDEWRAAVENDVFRKYFGEDGTATWDSPQGFGINKLKTRPAGFSADAPMQEYLRLKDYCCWHALPDSFFERANWLDEACAIWRAGMPMMHFINEIINDQTI